MSDQAATTETPAPPAPAAPPASPAPSQQETVSYDRFKQVNDKLQAEADRAKALDAQLKQIQRQGQSEAERAIAERDDALALVSQIQQERDDAIRQADEVRRAGIIRDAAAAAGFIDPADAVARLSNRDVKTAAAAEREVKALADSAPHLVSTQADGAGRKLERVLENGQNPAVKQQEETDEGAQQLLAQIQASRAASWASRPING